LIIPRALRRDYETENLAIPTRNNLTFENGVYFYRHLLSPAPLPFSLVLSSAHTPGEREKERERERMRGVGRGGGREGEMERAF